MSGRAIANRTRESILGSSCANWGTGTMDLTASSTSWIWAFKGSSPKSNSLTQSLSEHDNMGNLNFNLQVAKGGNSLNPFVASAQATGTGTASVGSPTADAASGNIGGSVDDQGFDQGLVTRARIAHGTIMGLAFVLFFPIGGIIIRVLSFRGLIWVHAGLQLLTYTLALAGMGLGVYIALKPDDQVRLILANSFYSPVLCAYIFFCIKLKQPFWPIAQQLPPSHRSRRHRPPRHPTLWRPGPSRPFQEIPCPLDLVARTRLDGPHCHHSRNNKWRLGAQAQR